MMTKRLLSILLLTLGLCGLATAADPLAIDRTTKRINETAIKLPSGSTLTIESGATLDLSAGTITLPSSVVTLTGTQALTNKTLNGLTISGTSGTFTLIDGKTLTVVNSITLAGTDTAVLDIKSGGNLNALAALEQDGLLALTGAGSIGGVEILGTSGEIGVTNGNAVLGSPTIFLEDTGVSAATYDRVTVDAKGRATAGQSHPWLFAEGSGGGSLHLTGVVVDFWVKTAGTGTITSGQSWSPGQAGWYEMKAWLGGSVTTDQVQLAFVVNGTTPYYAQATQFYRGVSGFNAVYLEATDVVTVSGIAYSGDWYASGDAQGARWIVRWLGPP